MTDRMILETIDRYGVAKEFFDCHDKVVEVCDSLERIERILKIFGSLDELEKALDLFSKQNYVLKEYFTLEEACAYLGVRKSTLRHYSSNHILPTYKPSGRLMFKKADIIAFIEKSHTMSNEEMKEFARNYCENNNFMPVPRLPKHRKK